MKRRSIAGFLVLVLAFSFCASGCKTREPAIEDAAPPLALAPEPAPEGLLADIVLTTPNATWSRIQRGVGGVLGILPTTMGGIVCAAAGLDPALGAEIDGASPVFGVLEGKPDAASLGFAIALKLTDPRKARAALVDAETARFTAREIGDLTTLVPKGNAAGAFAVALARGGYLVVARSEADLTRLAPYVTRTIPAKPLPAGALVIDVPGTALRGSLQSRLGDEWSGFRAEMLSQDEKLRAAHGGRAPDFGDPQAIVATLDAFVKRRLAMVGDLESARLSIDADEDDVHAVLALVPAPGGGPASAAIASMRPGDGAPLLDAPNSALTILLRDDVESRTRDAADAEAAIVGALGARLLAADAKKLHAVMEDWTQSRKGWMTLGLVRSDAVWLKAPSENPDRSGRALHGAMELFRVAPLKETLHVRDVTFASPAVPGIGPGTLAAISYGEGTLPPRKIEVTWAAGGGQISAFLSQKSGITEDTAAGKLGDDKLLSAAVNALEANATFAVVAQPWRLDPSKGSVPAPVVVAWGKKGGEGWARVEIADAILRDVVKSKMGL